MGYSDIFIGHTIGYIGPALAPAADAYAGGATTDVFNMENFHAGAFVIFQGAIEDANISNLVTLLACDDATPSNTSTMVFRYHVYTASTDAWAALGTATASGYNFNSNNAVANGIHVVEFTSDEVLSDGDNGYSYVQLSIAETADKTVTAGVLFIGLDPRHNDGTPSGATT